MKKLYIVVLIVLSVFIMPTVAKADMYPVFANNYAKQGTIGSEIVLELIGTKMFDGTIEYNKDILDYISVEEKSTALEGMAGPKGEFKIISNDPGKLVFEHKEVENSQIKLLFTFRIKAVPDDRKTNISYIPNNSDVIYGSKSIDLEYDIMPSSGVIQVCDQKECPKVETKPEIKEVEKIVEKPTKLTYVSFGISGVLLVTLVMVLLKKKNK